MQTLFCTDLKKYEKWIRKSKVKNEMKKFDRVDCKIFAIANTELYC